MNEQQMRELQQKQKMDKQIAAIEMYGKQNGIEDIEKAAMLWIASGNAERWGACYEEGSIM